MEGAFFYWIAWIFWIIATFLIKKSSQYRTKSAMLILLLIIFSSHQFMILGFHLNTAAIILYVFSLAAVLKKRLISGLTLFISSFMVMIAYTSFLLFEMFDPVWVIFSRKWMIAIMVVCISIFLHSDKVLRYCAIFIGSIQGEWLFSMILKRLTISYPVGDFIFLDGLATAALLVFCWGLIENFATYMDHGIKHQGREKQKST